MSASPGSPSRPRPRIVKFFNGEWLEWYVFMKLLAFFHERADSGCVPAQSGGHLCERRRSRARCLCSWSTNRIPLCIECKTGEFRQDIEKYTRLNTRLGLEKGQFLICALELGEKQIQGFNSMYGVAFAKRDEFPRARSTNRSLTDDGPAVSANANETAPACTRARSHTRPWTARGCSTAVRRDAPAPDRRAVRGAVRTTPTAWAIRDAFIDAARTAAGSRFYPGTDGPTGACATASDSRQPLVIAIRVPRRHRPASWAKGTRMKSVPEFPSPLHGRRNREGNSTPSRLVATAGEACGVRPDGPGRRGPRRAMRRPANTTASGLPPADRRPGSRMSRAPIPSLEPDASVRVQSGPAVAQAARGLEGRRRPAGAPPRPPAFGPPAPRAPSRKWPFACAPGAAARGPCAPGGTAPPSVPRRSACAPELTSGGGRASRANAGPHAPSTSSTTGPALERSKAPVSEPPSFVCGRTARRRFLRDPRNAPLPGEARTSALGRVERPQGSVLGSSLSNRGVTGWPPVIEHGEPERFEPSPTDDVQGELRLATPQDEEPAVCEERLLLPRSREARSGDVHGVEDRIGPAIDLPCRFVRR